MNLALKYRPRTFDDVVGQKANSTVLQAMISQGILDQVLLFTGPSGVGKTSMARIIAAQLNPEGSEEVHAGTHPAVLEIDAASNGSVERIRQLKRDVTYAIAGHRVIILDEAHAISDEGKAALLNLLEFPPKNVTFILLTTESHKIPKTIRHRCDHYHFKLASVEDLTVRLRYVAEKEQIEVDDDLINLLAQRAEGSYREALMLLNQVAVANISTIDKYNELHGEVDFGPSLVKSILSGPVSALNQVQEVLRYSNITDITDQTIEVLTEVMVLKAGNTLFYTGQALQARTELASKMDTERVLKAIRIMWDLQTKLFNGNPTRGLEMAYSLMGELFQANTPAAMPVPTAPTPGTRMSFAEMKNRS